MKYLPLLPAVVYVEETLSDLDKIEPSGVSEILSF